MNAHSQQSCVVITGSSKGIGLALARAFLAQGKAVVLSARNAEQLAQAQQQLQQEFPIQHVHAVCCDVTQAAQVEWLWQSAISHFKSVDIWINNAGSCTSCQDFTDLAYAEMQQVIQTNIWGCILASQIALKGMQQQGFGQIFNMEGWGSRGEWSAGMTVYATTKSAIAYFSQALYKESRHTPIRVGTLSPGMVATDLLVSSWTQGNPQHWRRMKRLFYFIIDPPDKVAHYLVNRIYHNQKSNVRIVWMTPWRLLGRFFLPAYWRRNPVQGTDLDHFS